MTHPVVSPLLPTVFFFTVGFTYKSDSPSLLVFNFFYYEQQIKWEGQEIHICGCRWNERLTAKTDGSTCLTYTGSLLMVRRSKVWLLVSNRSGTSSGIPNNPLSKLPWICYTPDDDVPVDVLTGNPNHQHLDPRDRVADVDVTVRQHTSAYVSICLQTS